MEDRFKHNVEKLFVQICGEDIRSLYVSRDLIPDYEIIVDREKYLDITKSKLKHFVHILQYFDHNARCTLVDLVPDELGKDLLSLMDHEIKRGWMGHNRYIQSKFQVQQFISKSYFICV